MRILKRSSRHQRCLFISLSMKEQQSLGNFLPPIVLVHILLTSMSLEETQPAQLRLPKKEALLCKVSLHYFTLPISAFPLILCLWMFYSLDKSLSQLKSGEEGVSHPVLGIDMLPASLECFRT